MEYLYEGLCSRWPYYTQVTESDTEYINHEASVKHGPLLSGVKQGMGYINWGKIFPSVKEVKSDCTQFTSEVRIKLHVCVHSACSGGP